MLTNGGRQFIAEMIGTPDIPVGDCYIELGTSGQAPDRSDTDLYAGYERKICVASRQSNIIKFDVEFGGSEGNPTPPAEIMEAGIFWNGATAALGSGVMIARFLVTPARPKVSGNIFRISWSGTVQQCDLVEDFIPAGTPSPDRSRIGEAEIGEPEIEG